MGKGKTPKCVILESWDEMFGDPGLLLRARWSCSSFLSASWLASAVQQCRKASAQAVSLMYSLRRWQSYDSGVSFIPSTQHLYSCLSVELEYRPAGREMTKNVTNWPSMHFKTYTLCQYRLWIFYWLGIKERKYRGYAHDIIIISDALVFERS